MKHSLSLLAGAILASLVPQPPQLSPTVREFLAGIEMVDLPNGVGGTVRAARYTGNLQIVNGTGFTSWTNGSGNLIVGYNVAGWDIDDRRGSHCVIVGDENEYDDTTHSSLVVGELNVVLEPSCFVAGTSNEATTKGSTICGGYDNRTTGERAHVCGGHGNDAFGFASVVSGGASRTAYFPDDWVAGGLYEDQ